MNLLDPTSLQRVKALIDLCRKEGVMQFASPEVSFTLGPKPLVLDGKKPDGKPADPEQQLEDALFPK